MLRTRLVAVGVAATIGAAAAGAIAGLFVARNDGDSAPISIAATRQTAGSTTPTAEVVPSSTNSVGPAPTATATSVIHVGTELPILAAKDLDTLVAANLASDPVVLIGTILGTEVADVPIDEGGERYTLATVKIDRWISKPVSGYESTLVVRQMGGTKDGVSILYEGEPLMATGDRFLFVLGGPFKVGSSAFFSGMPFGRFEIVSGNLRAVAARFADLGVTKEIAGMTEAQAASALAAVLAKDGIATADGAP